MEQRFRKIPGHTDTKARHVKCTITQTLGYHIGAQTKLIRAKPVSSLRV